MLYAQRGVIPGPLGFKLPLVSTSVGLTQAAIRDAGRSTRTSELRAEGHVCPLSPTAEATSAPLGRRPGCRLVPREPGLTGQGGNEGSASSQAASRRARALHEAGPSGALAAGFVSSVAFPHLKCCPCGQRYVAEALPL